MNLGKIFVIIGAIFIVVGTFFTLFKLNFSWFGKLVGDISYESEKFSFYMPLSSMMILSFIASIILTLLHKFFK